jgi:mono/diheme cytochrome c family protein
VIRSGHCRDGARSRVRRLRAAVMLLCGAGMIACEKEEYERPDRAAQVAEADSLLMPATFDTIAWTSPQDRAFAGNNVFAAKCRSCHGFMGDGGTEYAQQHNIAVPSLVREDWPYDNVPAVRTRIFTGHPAGMPTWGVAGITPREIDAVAYYIVEVLRPEVLGRR